MHIPDGFLDAKTAAAAGVFALAGVGLALRQVRRELPPRRVPLLGLAAAFLFAAQMLNFPVAGGTSGHLMGGVLVAALLGPAAAIVVVTTVLVVQCLLFADGGVVALGANIFNMGLVGAGAGGLIYRAVSRRLPGMRGRVTAIAFAGWCSTVLAAVSCAGQLAWSGTVAWTIAFPMMAGVHMLIGLGEGLISALVFLAIRRARPDLVGAEPPDGSRPDPQSAARLPAGPALVAASIPGIGGAGDPIHGGDVVRYGLLAALGLAVFVAPFACPWPDGLERVAERLGFEARARPAPVPVLAADYQVPGLHWAAGATALAGAAGTLAVFGLALLLGRWLVRQRVQEVRTNPAHEAGVQ
jgi:cobalt/nickel transport system permease protein